MRRRRPYRFGCEGNIGLSLYPRYPAHIYVNTSGKAVATNSTYRQIMRLSAGEYFALPNETLHSTFAVFSGVGTLMTTLLAFSFGENVVLTCIVYSTLVFPISSMIGCTLKGTFIFVVERYRINSNSPSGGMKEIVRSLSNFPSLTHWWNWQSSSSTAGFSGPSTVDTFLAALLRMTSQYEVFCNVACMRTACPRPACHSSRTCIPACRIDMRASGLAHRRPRGVSSL